jgi:hypothetical protein
MNGTSVISGPSLGNPGPSWHIKVSENPARHRFH